MVLHYLYDIVAVKMQTRNWHWKFKLKQWVTMTFNVSIFTGVTIVKLICGWLPQWSRLYRSIGQKKLSNRTLRGHHRPTCRKWPPWSWAAARWTAPHWSGGWWAAACWAGSRWKTGWSPAATHWSRRCGPACWGRCRERLRSCSRRPPDELWVAGKQKRSRIDWWRGTREVLLRTKLRPDWEKCKKLLLA